MRPPQLLILTAPVYRGSVAMRSVARDVRSTHYGDKRHHHHTMSTMGVVDPGQMTV